MCFKDNELSPHLTSCLLKQRTCLCITGEVESTRGTRNGTLIRYQTMISDLQPFDTYRFVCNTDCCSTKSEELRFQLLQSSRTLHPNLVLLSQKFVLGAGFQVHAVCMHRANCWRTCIHIANRTLPATTWCEMSTYQSTRKERVH